ncbi:MAG: hypothetical protein HC914_17235 [Chloroflexaceae bacterium]|nr:hypothetical protein [Chloroflexaceae bacterium]
MLAVGDGGVAREGVAAEEGAATRRGVTWSQEARDSARFGFTGAQQDGSAMAPL